MAAHVSTLPRRAMIDATRILDGLSTSVLIIDQTRSLLFLNVAAETLLGVSRNQACGRPLRELVADSSSLEAVIERAIEMWRPYSRRELTLRPIYGEGELVVDCTVAPFEDPTAPSAVIIHETIRTQSSL